METHVTLPWWMVAAFVPDYAVRTPEGHYRAMQMMLARHETLARVASQVQTHNINCFVGKMRDGTPIVRQRRIQKAILRRERWLAAKKS